MGRGPIKAHVAFLSLQYFSRGQQCVSWLPEASPFIFSELPQNTVPVPDLRDPLCVNRASYTGFEKSALLRRNSTFGGSLSRNTSEPRLVSER